MKPINQADSIDLFEPRLYVLPVIEAGTIEVSSFKSKLEQA